MNLFNVYPRFKIKPVKAKGVFIYNQNDQEYLDFYGGHGVISIGHSHPHYLEMLNQQMQQIGFYSNSVEMPLQEELANKLAEQCGYPDYQLFLCNSGAEANENALKLASFHTQKKKVIAFKNSFHGRTAAALNVTDNRKISAPINLDNFPVDWMEINNQDAVTQAFKQQDVAAVIIEGIQGVGGLDMPSTAFLEFLSKSCKENNALLIVDEIQSGYGRSGKFFAHQFAEIQADLITVAKGMGNGFPIGAVLISPTIQASAGLLGTTFGGNYLACAAGIAVLDVIKSKKLLDNVLQMEQVIRQELTLIPQIKSVKGKGLMLGISFDFPIKNIRNRLLYDHHIFTGAAYDPNLLRILPPLCIQKTHIETFINALKKVLI